MNDSNVDLVQQGIELAVRAGPLADSQRARADHQQRAPAEDDGRGVREFHGGHAAPSGGTMLGRNRCAACCCGEGLERKKESGQTVDIDNCIRNTSW